MNHHKWNYNLTNPLMVDSDAMIAVVFITYNVDSDACELHYGMIKSSTTLLMNARNLHYTCDMGLLVFNNIFACLC